MSYGDWRDGMKRLRPGAYSDGKGGLHIHEEEALEDLGVPNTAANRAALREATQRAADEGDPIPVVDVWEA